MNEIILNQQTADEIDEGQVIYNKIYMGEQLSIEELAVVFNSLVSGEEWISVENRLPEKNDYYAVVLNSPKIEGAGVAEAFWAGDRWDWGVSIRYENHMKLSVTHWQPLPAPPKE